jgi:hypothetical protein
MPRKGRTNKANLQVHVIQPNAAGVDVGSDEIYIAVPADRDSQPVRSFPTFCGSVSRCRMVEVVSSRLCRDGVHRSILDRR